MNHMYFIVILLCLVSAKKLNEHCIHENGNVVKCKCTGKQEFSFPLDFNFENLTSLYITSCTSVNVYTLSLGNAKVIRDIVIQNISGSLTFEPLVISRNIGDFRLSNIGKIPVIDHDTFTSISSIETFRIEDTRVIKFDEQFTNINTEVFILRNVTIDETAGINFSSHHGETLKIVDSIIRNIDGNLNLSFFGSIEILNSTFEFKNPSEMGIEGFSVKIANCVFLNVSMNLVARGNAVIRDNCADGKSSLRVSSTYVNSYGNKMPNEIIYRQKKELNSMLFRNTNNTVCKAGNCKCPKITGRNSCYLFNVNIYLNILLLLILCRL